MSRADFYDKRANRFALLGMLLLFTACLPVWWIVFDLIFLNTAGPWLLKFGVSTLLFGASMAAHSRSHYWADEANDERPLSTKEILSSPRWHGATTNENDN